MATAAETIDENEAFREEARAWLAENFPEELKNQGNAMAGVDGPTAETPVQRQWREAMGEKGWGVPTWPEKYGGGGLTPKQARILTEEMNRIGAYNPIGGMGVMMFGPTLLEYGTEEQKQEHIPPICKGEIRWCQGYSEPGAGSDLASLQTFGEDKGDHYLVNGQKTWTSGGQWADKCFCLVRTDKSEKHKGISFMLIDMNDPGVETRPIRLISGASPFCETFFTDVKVPKENLVGAEGEGWTIGKRLLQHERSSLSGGGGAAARMFSGGSLSDQAKQYRGVNDNGEIADKELRDKIIKFEMLQRNFMNTLRRASEEAKGNQGPTAATSIMKNVGGKITQERAELVLEIMGMNGLGWEGEGFEPAELAATRAWLWGKAVSVYGGSFEIQNNIVAKRILGMQDHQ
ncbi:MAG: acyl-CoA dehydrogenase family protein [Parasphingopyxis sp.]|uniref:acyl-CoA dehydrogenase family protein n=1 Tax=Parasphingopyxis sp. TaxID=1920299 RepID=UPI0026223319|nr:acyl-CoA dehydrogenase family protein [uncultured Parasphingopyxis sp.]